jgi:putative transposase
MLSEHRDEAAALRFLVQAVGSNGLPKACAIDKSGANTAAFKSLNEALKTVGSRRGVKVYRSKYLNNIVGQDHRNIKRRIRSMTGFKDFRSVAATLEAMKQHR